MQSRPKDLGTKYESARVNFHNACGLDSDREKEGGQYDAGDVWIKGGWIEEAKSRANLNPHQALHKALNKAGHWRVWLSHKRLTRKQGNQRRTPDGEPEVVSMHPVTAEVLLSAYTELSGEQPELVDSIWQEVQDAHDSH